MPTNVAVSGACATQAPPPKRVVAFRTKRLSRTDTFPPSMARPPPRCAVPSRKLTRVMLPLLPTSQTAPPSFRAWLPTKVESRNSTAQRRPANPPPPSATESLTTSPSPRNDASIQAMAPPRAASPPVRVSDRRVSRPPSRTVRIGLPATPSSTVPASPTRVNVPPERVSDSRQTVPQATTTPPSPTRAAASASVVVSPEPSGHARTRDTPSTAASRSGRGSGGGAEGGSPDDGPLSGTGTSSRVVPRTAQATRSQMAAFMVCLPLPGS